MSRQTCSLCGTIPLNILILECEHNICLQCAISSLYVQEKVIVCKMCEQVTQLDDQIIRDMIRSWTQKKKNQAENNETVKMKNSDKSLWRGLSAKSIVYNENRFQKQRSSFECKNHPQFELLYICQTCSNALICPQCAIHGFHKGHNVSTIKNYLQKINKELEEQQKKLDSATNRLQFNRKQYEKQYTKRSEQIQDLKKCAMNKYKIIHENLFKEEEKIIRECDELIHCYAKDFQNIQLQIIQQLKGLSGQKHKIEEILGPIYGRSMDKAKEISLIQRYIQYKSSNKVEDTLKLQMCLDKQEQIQVLTNRIDKINKQEQPCAQNKIPLKDKTASSSNVQFRQSRNKRSTIHNENFFVF